jgi:hypothetical protein
LFPVFLPPFLAPAKNKILPPQFRESRCRRSFESSPEALKITKFKIFIHCQLEALSLGGVEFGPFNPGKNFRKCIFPEPGSFLVLIFTRPTLFPVPVKKLCFFQQIFTVSGKHSVAFNFCHCQSNWE